MRRRRCRDGGKRVQRAPEQRPDDRAADRPQRPADEPAAAVGRRTGEGADDCPGAGREDREPPRCLVEKQVHGDEDADHDTDRHRDADEGVDELAHRFL